jgi:hypothetical protein
MHFVDAAPISAAPPAIAVRRVAERPFGDRLTRLFLRYGFFLYA